MEPHAEVQERLAKIESLAQRMRGAGEVTRINAYYGSTRLLAEIALLNERYFGADAYVTEKLTELRGHLACLADLDEGKHLPPQLHYLWVLGELTRIRAWIHQRTDPRAHPPER